MLTGFDDDLPQLTVDQVTAYPDSLEWWYFDLETAEGANLVVTFARKNPLLGSHCAGLSVEFQPAPGARRQILARNFPLASFTLERTATEACLRLDADNALWIERTDAGGIKAYRLQVGLGTLSGKLRFTPLSQGFKPGAEGRFFVHRDDARLANCVNFAAPWMEAEGHVTFQGATTLLRGEGYHDHPWGTDVYFHSATCWHWGKVRSADQFFLYTLATPAPAYEGKLRLVYVAARHDPQPRIAADLTLEVQEWRPVSWLNRFRFPQRLRVASQELGWQGEVRFARLLLGGHFYCRSRVTWSGASQDSTAEGWTEYLRCPNCCRGLLLVLTRVWVWLCYRV
jgi:hypothetical protein